MTISKSQQMKHSKWGPSSVPRIMLCRGCVQEVDKARAAGLIPQEKPSGPEAKQGQLEHDVCYELMTSRKSSEDVLNAALGDNHAARLRVTFSVDYVREKMDAIEIMSDGDYEFFFEVESDPRKFIERFTPDSETLEWLPEDLSGTSDVVLADYDNRHVYVYDYKFGYIDVPAEDNAQLLAYAMGAVAGIEGQVDGITIGVIQPKVPDRIKECTISFDELVEFSQKYAEAIVESTDLNAPRTPSEEACRFCAANGVCDAQKNEVIRAFDTISTEAAQSGDFELDDLVVALNSLGLVKVWSKGVSSAAQTLLEMGTEIPGYKLVRTSKHRQWVDQEKADKFMKARGLKLDERQVSKLASPAQAEKKLTKSGTMTKRTWTLFHRLYEKPEGELVIAPQDDEREAVIVKQEVTDAFKDDAAFDDVLDDLI